jgi:hypothetical protein
MAYLKRIGVLFVALTTLVFSDDFLRKLPDKEKCAKLKSENFKDHDAVIILKEQSLTIEPAEVFYRGVEIEGWHISRSKIIIAKLFTERAVERYGSFEYNYTEPFRDEISCGFEIHVRVLKENGKVWEMPKDEIKRLVTRKSSSGETVARKVFFKIPNLAPGDVVQYEYNYVRPLSYQTSGIFYYNDIDAVLYSNLYITLPEEMEVKYINLPDERIGKPNIKQISKTFGSGKTYFWSLNNLNPIREEVYSPPFADLSLMTAFVVEKIGIQGKTIGDWGTLGKTYYEYYLDDKDKITLEHIQQLGITELYEDSIKTLADIDKIYNSIRQNFKLRSSNSLYPLSDDVNLLFEEKEGDASDLAYIMYKILSQKNISVAAVWIRDKREGIYELEIPTTSWFDRMAILVNCGRSEQLYDFDQSIPAIYNVPWYLRGISLPVLTEGGCLHREVYKETRYKDNAYCEKHKIHIDSNMGIIDTISFCYQGAPADIIRYDYSDSDNSEIKEDFNSRISSSCLDEIDSLWINNIRTDNSIDIKINGRIRQCVEEVDQHLVLRLKNHVFEIFKDKVYSPVRKNYYQFESPFFIEVEWQIEIPDGYTHTIEKKIKRFKKVQLVSARVDYKIVDNILYVTGIMKFPSRQMSYTVHPYFMNLLDEFEQSLEEDIVFTKM